MADKLRGKISKSFSRAKGASNKYAAAVARIQETPEKPTLVAYPDDVDNLGFCEDCTAVHFRYRCNHEIGISKALCPVHVSFPVWNAHVNYTPQIIIKEEGKDSNGFDIYFSICESCKLRQGYETELQQIVSARAGKKADFDSEQKEREWLAHIQKAVAIYKDEGEAAYKADLKKKYEKIAKREELRAMDKEAANLRIAELQWPIERNFL